MLYHNEPILKNGEIVGHLTSGTYSHTLGGAVGLGYVTCLPNESQKKVLELVQEAHESIYNNITIPINMQYITIEDEIKRYMRE